MDGPFAVSSLFAPPSNNRKRNHDQISNLSSRQSPCSVYEAEASINNTRSFGLDNIRMPAIPRFRGDGLDMRRPVMSTQPPPQNEAHNVIDLTEDPPSPVFAPQSNVHPLNRRPTPHPFPRARRGPRYERDIIDAETPAVDLRESSPEVEFIRARPRAQSAHGPSYRPVADTTRTRATLRPFSVAQSDRGYAGPTTVSGVARFLPDLGAFLSPWSHRPRDELVQVDDWPLSAFEAPELNFNLQGFNLEQPSRPIEQPPRLPIYDAPPPPRTGFTRELKEDDLLVCANCDDELGAGEEDVKRQVWIIKACGHVYCGECTKNRSANPKNTPPSQRSKPFKKCVVEDCGKRVSKATMIQLYL